MDTDGNGVLDAKFESEYKGWMVDAGVSYFCGPFTLNAGGFYTSGDELDTTAADVINGDTFDTHAFTYHMATAKYFSEIGGGGILDHFGPDVGFWPSNGWRGYGHPSNLWTLTVGGAYQVLEKTKLSAAYWYFGTSEDVISDVDNLGLIQTDDEIGHELDFYVSQGIVDGLTLDLVAAYLFTGDAYSPSGDDDFYELGARLQWNF
jgi:hypothetical protein